MVKKIKRVQYMITRLAIFFSLCLLIFNIPAFSIKATGGFSSPYFQADYIQDLCDFSSGIVNPALLYRVNQKRIELGGYRWGFDLDVGTTDLGYQQASFILPIRLNQTAGLTLIGVGSNIDSMRISAAGTDIVPTGKILRYGDLWIVGHYSARLLPWLMIGANPKIVRQNQFDQGKSYGFALDAGVYVNPFDHYRFGDLGFSINFQDIIPANLKWQTGDVKQLMTTRFRAGFRYAILNDKIVGAGEVVVDNLFVDLWDNVFNLVSEAEKGDTSETGTFNATDYLQKIGRFSGHLRFEFIPQVWLKIGWANNNIPYVGFNINLIYPLPEMINYFRFDTHIGYSVNERERGLTLMTKAATDFGYTREQIMSKRLYDLLILAPMNAYNEAMRLYLAGKYWEAGFAFGKVLSLFPNFHLNDKATFYLGNCYRFLRMNDIAREVYKEGLAEYTTSEVRAKYLYGLQDLDYREGKYEDALKNHAFIINLYGENEIRPDADYLAGQIQFLRKNYNAAEQLLSGIDPGSPAYMYAQYTLAIINVENNKMKIAAQNLMSITSDTTEDAGELLLQDAANNKLGQLYFEQVELRKAVEAFSLVPEESVYGDEALLGIAWSWVKVNRPEEALRVINGLITMHPQSPLVPEGHLVKGYTLMLLKRNREAAAELQKCLELCKKEFASEKELEYKRQTFNQYIQTFAPSADKIKKNALRKPTPKSIEERGELKTEFDKFSKEARDFFEFSLLVDDNKKFFRRKEEIVEDAEYALAKATKLIGTAQETKIIEKHKEEATEIEDEIEKLKKQLEEETGGE